MIKANRDGQEMHFENSDELLVFMVERMTFRSELEEVKADLAVVKADMGSMKQDIVSLKMGMVSLNMGMVTKEYLDDKFSDNVGKNMQGVVKRDERLIDALQEKKVFTPEEGNRLKNFQPLTPAR